MRAAERANERAGVITTHLLQIDSITWSNPGEIVGRLHCSGGSGSWIVDREVYSTGAGVLFSRCVFLDVAKTLELLCLACRAVYRV